MRSIIAIAAASLVAAGPASGQSHAQHHPAPAKQARAMSGMQECPQQMQQMQQMMGQMQQMMGQMQQMHQQMMGMMQQHQGMGMGMPNSTPPPDPNKPH